MAIRMDIPALEQFLQDQFPQALAAGFRIEHVDVDGVRLRLLADAQHLRPGGTVMGPTLMMLADTAVYLAILSRVGPVALAVTTSLEMHFLKRAPPGELIVHGRLLKLGRRLAVGSVDIAAEGVEGLVGHATVTYALPGGGAA